MVSLTLGNTPLPFTDGGIGHIEPLGTLLLCQAQIFPPLTNKGAEGLSVSHKITRPEIGCGLQDYLHHIAVPCKVKKTGADSHSTVRKVLDLQDLTGNGSSKT